MIARRPRVIQLPAAFAVTANPRLDLLGARLFDISLLLRLIELARAFVPLLLPVGERCFGALQRLRRGLLGMLGLLQTGHQFVQRQLELGNLGLVLVDVLDNLFRALDGLLEVLFLPLAKLVGVLDRLLEPRDLGPHLVIAALDFVEEVGSFRLPNACTLDTGFELPLTRNLLLEACLAFVKPGAGGARLVIEVMRTQRQQFRRRTPLLFLVAAIALCGLRLAVEMLDVLFDFLEDVPQAIQVFLGVLDTVGGLFAPLLVLGNTRGFFQEDPHLFRLGLDEAGNHPLLDDRVAAGSEARTEKHARDVLTAAARAVQVVGRDAVAADLAPDTDFRVLGVLPFQRRIGIVEQQFDRGCAHGLAGTGAVENHVRDGIAAKPARRALSHDPADGIDYIGFTAAVGPHHANEATGKGNSGGVYK